MWVAVNKPLFSLCVVLLFNLAYHGYAESCPEDIRASEWGREAVFTKGRLAFQSLAGVLHSPVLINRHWHDINYYQANARLGVMLTDPKGRKHFPRGNTEGIIEFTHSDVLEDGGDFISGITCLLRCNFVSPHSKLFPYIQAGAGVVYDDIYKDRSQSLVGQSIEFTLRGGAGARFLVADNWSIDVEGTFEHISCAGMSDRNGGINAGGAFIGFTRYFL